MARKKKGQKNPNAEGDDTSKSAGSSGNISSSQGQKNPNAGGDATSQSAGSSGNISSFQGKKNPDAGGDATSKSAGPSGNISSSQEWRIENETGHQQDSQQEQSAWQSRGKQLPQQQRQWEQQSSGMQQIPQDPSGHQHVSQQEESAWQSRGKQLPQQQRQWRQQSSGMQQTPQGPSGHQDSQQQQSAWQSGDKQRQWEQQSSGMQQIQQGPSGHQHVSQQQQSAWQSRGKQQPQQQRQWRQQSSGMQQTPQGPSGHQQVSQQQQSAWQSRGKQLPQQQRQWGQQSGSRQQIQQGSQEHQGYSQESQLHQGQVGSSTTPQETHRPQGQLQQGTQGMSMELAKRGTRGRIIVVETNYFSFDPGTLEKAYHYDVEINPDKPKKWQREVFEHFRKKHFPTDHPAFDGRKNLYTTKELILPNKVLSDEIEIDLPNETKKKSFKVSMKFATVVDLSSLKDMKLNSSQQALQCVETVLRSAPAMRCIPAGRSFYLPPEKIIDLGEGMEMYNGFYQSVVRGWKPFFNIDVAHKAFPIEMNVTQAIIEVVRKLTLNDLKDKSLPGDVEAKVAKHLKRLRILYEVPGIKREYTINGLDEPPRYKKITVDNRTMTIEEYFQKKKNLKLNYPLMPTLWVGSLNRQDKILLPLELCTIMPNQVVNRKMTDPQKSNMIRQTATSTEVRKKKIIKSMEETRHNEDPCVKQFGFRLNSDFEKVEARVLQPPELEYGNGAVSRPGKGVWRQNGEFFVGAEAASWIIISVCGNMKKECTDLETLIYAQGTKCGMKLAPKPGPYDFIGKRQPPTEEEIRDILQKNSNYNLIFVIIPDFGSAYAFVKKAAELHLNCLTQCIKQRTMKRMNASTVGNILLKVNSKLSGTNHCLKTKPWVLDKPCMIMGADVTHPSPDSQNIPSVVAVIASHDPKAFKYNMCCRLQKPTVEIIEDMEEITKEQLMHFYKENNGQKPQRIIFFRDGVSEGQFNQVKQTELMAIRRACTNLEQGYEPKITFVVVQKRHHTRFFPNRYDSEDKNFNVPAGTCVDTVITSPNMQDFYLVSHASIQGVAKPTKYTTIWDDSDLSYDDIEELAYYLCHLFARCNRSVSYPAPTYYAHLGAARAKVYIENEPINFHDLKNEQEKLKNDVIRKQLPMFFV